jgi:hypothetical protein
MTFRRRRACLDRIEAELAGVREELGHARYDLRNIDRDTYTRVEVGVNVLREEIAALRRAAEANERRVIEVGPAPPAGEVTWLSIAFRSPDHALETAEALRQAAHAAMSGRAAS